MAMSRSEQDLTQVKTCDVKSSIVAVLSCGGSLHLATKWMDGYLLQQDGWLAGWIEEGVGYCVLGWINRWKRKDGRWMDGIMGIHYAS